MLSQTFCAILFSPAIDVARSCRCRFFIWLHKFSMGLRSGLFPGQPSKSLTPRSWCHFFVDLARCGKNWWRWGVEWLFFLHFFPPAKSICFLLSALISKRIKIQEPAWSHSIDLLQTRKLSELWHFLAVSIFMAKMVVWHHSPSPNDLSLPPLWPYAIRAATLCWPCCWLGLCIGQGMDKCLVLKWIPWYIVKGYGKLKPGSGKGVLSLFYAYICVLTSKQVKRCYNIVPEEWTGVHIFYTLYGLAYQRRDQHDGQKDKASRKPPKN